MRWVLHTDRGEALSSVDLVGRSSWLLSCWEDTRYPMLRWVTRYFDSHFSPLQMQGLIPELESLLAASEEGEVSLAIEKVLHLANRCSVEPGLRLTWQGD